MTEAVRNSTTTAFINDCVALCAAGAAEAYREDAESRAMESLRDEDVEKFESPLEEAFARCWAILQFGADYRVTLEPQVELHRYRIDFVVRSTFARFPKIAIELDGHEFHEKTKEQVARRNERDRSLLMAGWRVFHVSGSEFYRNPYDIVSDIHGDAVEEARVCDAYECGCGRRA